MYEDYTTDWKTENAQKNMETALNQASNKIDAVVSENDSMAIGVVAALQKVGLAGTVPVSGQDGDEANLNNVAKGLQTVDVWKDAFALGKTAGQAAIQLCKGNADRRRDGARPTRLRQAGQHRDAGLQTRAPRWTAPKVVKSIVLTPVAITPGQPRMSRSTRAGSPRTSCARASTPRRRQPPASNRIEP